jgi:YD repeat-containing protein
VPTARALATDDVFDGDPVSLSTGLYWRSDDDVVVAGTPLVLTRTYRTRDDRSRPFGIGVSHSYYLYLIGDGENFQWADLVLADGGRIHYRRIASGRTHADAVFEHRESPTEFYGSQLQWNGGGWTIDLRDGSRYMFGACTPGGKDLCHLLGKRDAGGTEVQLQHDEAGDLTDIRSGAVARISLTYDTAHRIVRATASTGAVARYEYDKGGHLTRVTTSDGRVQEYTYGEQHEVRSIREPDRLIENSYDAAVRCIKQVITFGARGEAPRADLDVYTFAYRLNPEKRIVETKTVQPDGTVRIVTFNQNGYLVTDTSDPGGQRFSQVIYARDDRTNLSPRVTVRCNVGGQIVEAFALVSEFEHPDTVRGALLARTCH